MRDAKAWARENGVETVKLDNRLLARRCDVEGAPPPRIIEPQRVARTPEEPYQIRKPWAEENLLDRAAVRAELASKFEIAARIAPVLRRREGASRKLHLVGKDGKPTRATTDVEYRHGVLKRLGIELALLPGKRPTQIVCETCRSVVTVKKRGTVPTRCASCRYGRCSDCGADLGRDVAHRARKDGKTPRCKACRKRRTAEKVLGRAATEAVCMTCKAALPVPKNAAAAFLLRHRYPEGRECAACVHRARFGAARVSDDAIRATAAECATWDAVAQRLGLSAATISRRIRSIDGITLASGKSGRKASRGPLECDPKEWE